MFAGDIPFSKEATGYDKITMRMESDDGHSISMTRKIVDGKTDETGAGTVEVISNVPWIDNKSYSISKYEYSDMLLSLLALRDAIASYLLRSLNLTT